MLRATCALLALAATAAAGCGGVPGGAVATVDGDEIARESFDHWLTVVAKSGGRADAQVPRPPAYEACIAQKDAKPADAQAEAQCRQEYEALRDQTLQLLISFRWIEGEAEERGISVEDDAVRKSFETLKRRSFPQAADYEKFLSASGQTEEDILARVRYDLLSGKIREQVVEDQDELTDERVAAYYQENRPRFAAPERRDVRIVRARTRDRAEQALAALEAGSSWASVAGEKLPGVTEGEQPKALDKAIFEAAKDELTGPVKTEAGYYVLEVTRVRAAAHQTLEEVKPTIEQQLTADVQQKALDGYLDDFRRRWKAKTECGEGFVTGDCGNSAR